MLRIGTEDDNFSQLFKTNFSTFVKALAGSSLMTHTHFRPQSDYLLDRGGDGQVMIDGAGKPVLLVDTILRFESFPENAQSFLRSLGVPLNGVLPHLRASSGKAGISNVGQYDAETEQIVRHLYAYDFVLLGYADRVVQS